MSLAIFSTAYEFIDGRLAEVLGERTASVLGAVAPIANTAVLLYFILFGWAVIQGKIDEPIMDFIARSVKLVFVVQIGTTSLYNQYVTGPLFTTIPNWLAGMVSGGAVTDAGTPFDEFFAAGLLNAEKIAASSSGFMDFGPLIVAACVAVVAGLSAAIGFAIFMIAKIALAVLVALGPLFIACLIFEPTRRFFYGWLSQAVNYLLLFCIIIIMHEMVVNLVFQNGTGSATGDPMLDGYIFMALAFLGTVFFLQAPSMAAGIAGGASAGIQDFKNMMPKGGSGGGSGLGGGGGGGKGSIQKK